MLVRSYRQTDEDSLVQVWYESTIIAHDFIPEEMWHAHKDALRNKYLPNTETWVAEEKGELVGFISILGNYVGALFVKPSWQGQAIGSKLIETAKEAKGDLTVGVYKKNQRARRFYEKCGFKFQNEELQQETGEIVENMAFTLIRSS